MLKNVAKALSLAIMITVLATTAAMAAPDISSVPNERTVRKIRKELVMLPYYGVFDNLAFRYEEGIVTLYGQVSRPSLKSDAARVVEKVEGVDKVINRIEVLPLSGLDDRIRIATYRAIYRQPGFDRLSFMANPPVHIIVKNGHVTLEGVVLNKSEATRAFLAANGVPNVFSVTNNLKVERK